MATQKVILIIGMIIHYQAPFLLLNEFVIVLIQVNKRIAAGNNLDHHHTNAKLAKCIEMMMMIMILHIDAAAA